MLWSLIIERECAEIFRMAGILTGSLPAIGDLIEAIMGLPPKFSIVRTLATTARTSAGWQVYIKHGLPSEVARWLAARELARWWLARCSRCKNTEENARRLGSALLAPRELFIDTINSCGIYLPLVASMFGVQQALVLLRIGETTGLPVVLLDDQHHLATVRGDPARWNRRHGITKVQLTDDARVGLIAG